MLIHTYVSCRGVRRPGSRPGRPSMSLAATCSPLLMIFFDKKYLLPPLPRRRYLALRLSPRRKPRGDFRGDAPAGRQHAPRSVTRFLRDAWVPRYRHARRNAVGGEKTVAPARRAAPATSRARPAGAEKLMFRTSYVFSYLRRYVWYIPPNG